MKKIILIVVLAQIISCSGQSDENCHLKVKILNSSTKVIYFGGAGSTPGIGYNPLKSGTYFKMTPDASYDDIFSRHRGCYEDFFEESNNKQYYLLYDEEILLNNTWEDIRANDMVLKRYSFTLEEMQEVNWTIIYDGN